MVTLSAFLSGPNSLWVLFTQKHGRNFPLLLTESAPSLSWCHLASRYYCCLLPARLPPSSAFLEWLTLGLFMAICVRPAYCAECFLTCSKAANWKLSKITQDFLISRFLKCKLKAHGTTQSYFQEDGTVNGLPPVYQDLLEGWLDKWLGSSCSAQRNHLCLFWAT